MSQFLSTTYNYPMSIPQRNTNYYYFGNNVNPNSYLLSSQNQPYYLIQTNNIKQVASFQADYGITCCNNLNIILVAILLLVSLDLIIVRPTKNQISSQITNQE